MSINPNLLSNNFSKIFQFFIAKSELINANRTPKLLIFLTLTTSASDLLSSLSKDFLLNLLANFFIIFNSKIF